MPYPKEIRCFCSFFLEVSTIEIWRWSNMGHGRRSTVAFKFQVPRTGSKNRFQQQVPTTGSNNRFQEQVPRTVPRKDSKNRFQEQIPITDSKNRFQEQIPRIDSIKEIFY